ncbi:MAG: KTSC domain-containing protein [Bradyrhizobium sp.]|nr:KTSC domain-containing protein [Bradyrhizobium sp.]
MRLSAQLQSTALAGADFVTEDDAADDAEKVGALTITFASGSSYTYENVPLKVFEELQAASSPGKYYHQNIKDAY